jgi:hypothetical protein
MSKSMNRKMIPLLGAAAGVLLIAGWLLVGGRTRPDARMSGAMYGGLSVPFSTLDQSVVGAWRCAGAMVCRSAEEWNGEMASMGSACLDMTPPLPTVDWDNYMVFLVTLGEKSTAGYAIEVQDVRDEGGELVVEVAVTEPHGGAQQQIMTSPFHMVLVERREAPGLRVDYVTAGATPTQDTSWGKLKRKFKSGV